MAAITAAIGLGLAAVGVGTQIYGSQKTAEANEDAIAAQQHALAIQEKAREMDATRQRRKLVRESIIARSQALSTTTNQGANESSGLPGAYGQIAGRTSFGISGINIAEETSQQLYGANQELFQAKLAANDATSISAIGSGLTSLGGALTGNIGAIDRIYNTWGGSPTASSSTSFVKYS